MTVLETATLSVTIDAPFDQVAQDLADPTTHPEWGTEFFSGPVATEDGECIATIPAMGGRVRYRVDADPERGLFDIYLAPQDAPFGPPIPVRLLRNGDGVDVVWTLARFPGMPAEQFGAGVASMKRELGELQKRHEGR